MQPTAGCTNPKCTCDPCTCSDCKCGVTTLGDLERRVMEILWEHPGIELSGRQIADRLPGYAYTTVATVLGRLGDKGQGSSVKAVTEGGRSPETMPAMVTSSSTERRLARTATQTVWRCSAAPS